MGAKGAFVAASLGFALFACGGSDGGGGSTYGEPTSEKSATEPAASSGSASPSDGTSAPAETEAEGPPAAMKLSPACGKVGSRVVLTLGLTNDRRVPSCYDASQTQVTFAPNKNAKITSMGSMSDGFCALDVEIPKGAESGKIQVAIGRDVFESDVVFGIPCP